jgi:hypothetical protein
VKANRASTPPAAPCASSPWTKSDRAVRSGFGPDARSSEAPNTRGIQANGDTAAWEAAGFARRLPSREVWNPLRVPRPADGPEPARTATWRLCPRAAGMVHPLVDLGSPILGAQSRRLPRPAPDMQLGAPPKQSPCASAQYLAPAAAQGVDGMRKSTAVAVSAAVQHHRLPELR